MKRPKHEDFSYNSKGYYDTDGYDSALEAYADYLESENKRLKKFEAYCKRNVHPREWKEQR